MRTPQERLETLAIFFGYSVDELLDSLEQGKLTLIKQDMYVICVSPAAITWAKSNGHDVESTRYVLASSQEDAFAQFQKSNPWVNELMIDVVKV